LGLPQDDWESTRRKKLDKAYQYARDRREDEAYAIFADLLKTDFDDSESVYGLARLYFQAENYGLAYNLYRLAAGFKNRGTGPWNGMGLCHAETWDLDAAQSLFKRALSLDPTDKHALGNMSLIHLLKCEPEKCLKFGEMALKQDLDFPEVFHHMTYAKLMLGQWKEGWEGHKHILGQVKTRAERFYENHGKMLPRWDGTPGQTVVVYGEQGIGDEISFASCIPDLVKVSKKVVLDCDHRLENLFRASFPEVDVHGTRFKNPMDWIDNYHLDARVAIGDLPGFFRNSDEEFPGTPYLKVAPGGKTWAGLEWMIDAKPKPVIGITWTGGLPNTGSVKRSLSLEAIKPILKAAPATWVCLEHKDRANEIKSLQDDGINIVGCEAAQSKNYLETAELVNSLDLVISVTTAVVHLSGALGKECWVLVPSKPRWWYGTKGDSPWYKSAKFFRQEKDKGWDGPISQIVKILKLRYS
jgi:intracellular sulfur oxidation DsrE/DsrF family protein